jgi:ATP-dependent RNA helicase DeaD
MKTPDHLDDLTLKDLRRIAGEQQIPNRSRLGRDELLEALKGVLVNASQGSAAAASVADPEVLSPDTVAPSPRSPVREPPPADPAEDEAEDDGDETAAADDTAPVADCGRHPTTPAAPAHPAHPATIRGRDDRPPGRDRPRHETPRGPAKPVLEGPQPRLPQVFDRFRRLAQGLIDLCDPATPSWAQPFLAELLANAGVVPMPCRGRPHPDFHEVVGRVAAANIEPGGIAIIEAPGFAVRGDRGDLFCLRKAKVKVADSANGGGGRPVDQPRDGGKDDDRDDAGPRRAPPADQGTDPDDDDDDDHGPADTVDQEVNRQRDRDDRDQAEDNNDGPDAGPLDGNDAAATDGVGNADGDPGKALAVAPAIPAATAVAAVAGAATPAVEIHRRPPPPPGRNALHRRPLGSDHHPQEEAPILPLVPQEAEELGARPKAEGFRPLELNEQILADLADIGYAQPLPIQTEAIPLARAGKDLIGQALTGTGKTAAFVLPILDRLYTATGRGPIALILCPTRELARQVHGECVRMAGRSGARAIVVYGGVSMDDQFEQLAHHPHIVVGTPGRLIDHLRRKTLDLSRLTTVVLDEADQMLDIGFLPDIEYILRHSPPVRQTLLFSATMPDEIRRLAEKYMRNPETVDVMPEKPTVAEVDQKYIAVDQDRKTSVLAHFIDTQQPEQLLVFCRTKHQTDRVAQVLKHKRMSAAAIHGDLPQTKRERTLRDFRARDLQCLIATNVAARGLDIPSVSHVVNYDVPETPEEYVHRIGRTARNGARGVARTFVTPNDGQFLLEIEKHIGQLLDEEEIPGITASTAIAVKRTIAESPSSGTQRLIKPLLKGVRLGRRRR